MCTYRCGEHCSLPRFKLSSLSGSFLQLSSSGSFLRLAAFTRFRLHHFPLCDVLQKVSGSAAPYPQAPQLPHSFTFIPRRSPQLHLPSCTSLMHHWCIAPGSRKIAKNDNIDTKRNNRDKKVPELQPPAPPMLCYTNLMQHAPKQMHMYLC